MNLKIYKVTFYLKGKRVEGHFSPLLGPHLAVLMAYSGLYIQRSSTVVLGKP